MATTDKSETSRLRPGRIFDGSFWFLAALAVLSAGFALAQKGTAILPEAGGQFLDDVVLIAPKLVMGVMIGALFTLLMPRAVVARIMGEEAGFRGILISAVIGMATPAGPFTSFPLIYALGRSGAAPGPMMAFVVGWAVLGLNRLIIWEVPFLGSEFTILHLVVSLPAPIIAGVLARELSSRVPSLRVEYSD